MNKHIEEMARELCGLSIEYETCEMCNSEVKVNCAYKSIVTTMMTIMAREIFEEIDKICHDYNRYEIGERGLFAKLAEFKKKYESEEAE